MARAFNFQAGPAALPLPVIEKARAFDSSYAALYYPWLRVNDPLRLGGTLRSVPPCGHVAGIYARVELRDGVHKPPANEELEAVQDVARPVDDELHAWLNRQRVDQLQCFLRLHRPNNGSDRRRGGHLPH